MSTRRFYYTLFTSIPFVFEFSYSVLCNNTNFATNSSKFIYIFEKKELYILEEKILRYYKDKGIVVKYTLKVINFQKTIVLFEEL